MMRPMSTQLRFLRRVREAHNTFSSYFEPDAALHFAAGQYLSLALPHAPVDGRGFERSFTIASSPSEPLVRLTTRASTPSSSFKHALAGLAPGAMLEADGPFGEFVYRATRRPAVFIAGGIGITPFRSMLGELATRRARPEIWLLYSNATPDFPFRAFLDMLAADWPQLHVVYRVTRPSPAWDGPTGRIDAAFIERHVPPAAEADFYICGPSAMVDSMRGALLQAGTEATRIHDEGFPGYEARPAPECAVPGI